MMIEYYYLEYQEKKYNSYIQEAIKTCKVEPLQKARMIKTEMIGYQIGLQQALDIYKTTPFDPKETEVENEIKRTKEKIIKLFENI